MGKLAVVRNVKVRKKTKHAVKKKAAQRAVVRAKASSEREFQTTLQNREALHFISTHRPPARSDEYWHTSAASPATTPISSSPRRRRAARRGRDPQRPHSKNSKSSQPSGGTLEK